MYKDVRDTDAQATLLTFGLDGSVAFQLCLNGCLDGIVTEVNIAYHGRDSPTPKQLAVHTHTLLLSPLLLIHTLRCSFERAALHRLI